MPAETRGVFVTATDTGVGKTLVSSALAYFLRSKGLRVGVMKPVETGVEDPTQPGPDAALLAWAAQSQSPPELISPYRFRAPMAPSLAAREEGCSVDLNRIIESFRSLASEHDFIIVEGAGGLMVPVAGGILIADLVHTLDLPLLTICRPGLGTINHSLLTLFAARTMELPLAGFMINNMPKTPSRVESTAPHTLASLASADLLGVIDQVEGTEQEKVRAISDQIAQLPTLPWLLMNLGLGHLIH